MKLVFISNYFNHHQKELSDCFFEETGGDFLFIETTPMNPEKASLGWNDITYPKYVIKNNELKNRKIKKMINTADIVIYGSCPISLIRKRLMMKKLTFRYSERIFKKNLKFFFLKKIKYFFQYGMFKKNHFLLCASAYAKEDYDLLGFFKNQSYKWGYFPKCFEYDADDLISKKENNSIIWCSRFIDWKHPEIPVEIAKELDKLNVDYKMRLLGNGIMQEEIEKQVKQYNLGKHVSMLGSIPSQKVRKYFEMSSIFLFTSDKGEGWGAVLNEAMNSACVPIANKDIGSAPYLIAKENGFLYTNHSAKEIALLIQALFSDKERMNRLEKESYKAIKDNWNAHEASIRFLNLAYALKNKKQSPYENGLCSIA